MATNAVSDCFSIGSTVSCTTCFNQNFEGEVMAFDSQTKMLILKCPSSTKLYDISIVNLSLCSDVQVRDESDTTPEAPQSLNLKRLSTRVRTAIEEKKLMVSALKAGVSAEGHKLYLSLIKIITQIGAVCFSGSDIIVFGKVTISPPYKVDNVTGNVANERTIYFVKQLVEKFYNAQSPGNGDLTDPMQPAITTTGSPNTPIPISPSELATLTSTSTSNSNTSSPSTGSVPTVSAN